MAQEYKVTWEIEVDSSSPRDAARQAMEIQRDKDSIACVFRVTDASGNTTVVDLLDELENVQKPGPGN